jgi:hypothetical protein
MCHPGSSYSFSLTTIFPRPRSIEKRVKMTHDVKARSKHSPANQGFLDGVSARQLMDFRTAVRVLIAIVGFCSRVRNLSFNLLIRLF